MITKQDASLDPLQAFGLQGMTQGLPDFQAQKDFSSGTVAQSTAPAAGGVIRRLAASGLKTSDPASQGVMGDFAASNARSYDANLNSLLTANNAAKQAGANNLAAVASARNPIPALSLYGTAAYS
jgi:hypothetical protein